MAEYISFQPSDFFNTKLYAGNSSTQAITGVGFQPDFVWLKNRTDTNNHRLYDASRGVENSLISDDNSAQSTSTGLTAFDSDGFTLGSTGSQNGTGHDYASWNWKAGTTSGLSGGTLTPTAYSINTTSKFGIYTYSGTGATATIAHGLGVAPGLIIVKRTDTTANWAVYQEKNIAAPATDYLILNLTNVTDDDVNLWNDTAPTSTVFTIKSDAKVNNSSGTYVAYAFANVKGYSKIGTYKGNSSSTDGPFAYTGFKPAFVMVKAPTQTVDWWIVDNKRLGYNVDNNALYPNDNKVESTSDFLDLLSNGFKLRSGSGGGSVNISNTSGEPYLYIAFAESPIVSSNDVPTVAR